MPRLRNARAISLETSSSSSGARRGQGLDQRHLGAERAIERCELQARRRPRRSRPPTSGIRSYQSAWSLVMMRSVTSTPGSSLRRGAGRDHDVGGVDAAARRPRRRSPGHQRRAMPVTRRRSSARFTSPVTPLTSLSTTASSNALTARPVGLARGLDAPLLGAVHGVHDRRRLQQRLRGDAASEQTGAAEPVVALDEGDALPELRGAEGGGVARRPAADHDYVVRVTHPTSQSTGLPRPERRTMLVRGRRAPCRAACDTPLEAVHRSARRQARALRRLAHADRVRRRARASTRRSASASGLFDLTHLGKVDVTGPGALGMLQRVVTNDLSNARRWERRSTTWC